jgi:hypothetical protein
MAVTISKDDIDRAFRIPDPLPHDPRGITHKLLYRPSTGTFHHVSPANRRNGTEWDIWELRTPQYLKPKYTWERVWICRSLEELKSRLSLWGIEEIERKQPFSSFGILSRLYELVYGESLYHVEREGRPKCNKTTWGYIYQRFWEFDRKFPMDSDMFPGGLWERDGWEIDDSLPDWEVLPAPSPWEGP